MGLLTQRHRHPLPLGPRLGAFLTLHHLTPMTKEKPPSWLQKPPLSADAQRIKDTITRLQLTDTQAAQYLGVPVTTLRNWTTGQRAPGAAVMRLLEILGTIEVMNPVLHAALMPAASPAPARRGRPPKEKTQ